MPKKEKIGIVTSNKNAQTVVVRVAQYSAHPKYKKIIESNKSYVAADFNSECSEGDKVLIQESKPLSKTKRWKVTQVIEKVK